MNNNSKRILAALAAAGLLSSGAVFAEYNPDKVVDTTLPYMTTSAPLEGEPAAPENFEELSPVLNGATLYQVEVQELDSHILIPLRQVAEGLGYTVEWKDETQSIELVKGAQFITMAIGSDSYAFSRMAPVSLGLAPTLIDGSTTYVPIELISEVMNGSFSKNEDGTYKIVQPSIVTVKEVNEDKTLLVSDAHRGEVLLRITDETKITADGKEVSSDEIKADSVLAVEYAQIMNPSLPPQVNAVTIDIQNLPVESEQNDNNEEQPGQQSVAFSGEIKEVTETDKATFVLLDNDSEINEEIILVVSEETVITKGNDKRVYKAADLKEGMEIEGTHSMAMTMSLPPQTAALSINIKSDDDQDRLGGDEDRVEFSGTIASIEDNGYVLIKDNDGVYSEIALIVSEDTKITKGDDKRIYKLDDLKAGMKIEGTHSPAMTRSIPPQTAAFEIEIDD